MRDTRPHFPEIHLQMRSDLLDARASDRRVINDSESSQFGETSRRIACSRREFLRVAAGVGLASSTMGFTPLLHALNPRKNKKCVVVTFGGGARDQETFAAEGQENIPNLIKYFIPQATFFPQVVNRGILGHYVANASLATGVYERVNNFASLPPEHPTVFEYFRKDLKRPASDAWVVVSQ